MRSSRRPKRAAELIRSELGYALRVSVEDAILQKVSITNVDMAGDLRTARIHVICEGVKSSDLLGRLNAARGYFRKILSEKLDLRWVPELKFELDEHVSKVDHLLRLIDEVRDHQ